MNVKLIQQKVRTLKNIIIYAEQGFWVSGFLCQLEAGV